MKINKKAPIIEHYKEFDKVTCPCCGYYSYHPTISDIRELDKLEQIRTLSQKAIK